MTVKHRKFSRAKGDAARAEYRDQLKDTLNAIKEVEELDGDPGAVRTASRSELARRFGALR